MLEQVLIVGWLFNHYIDISHLEVVYNEQSKDWEDFGGMVL